MLVKLTASRLAILVTGLWILLYRSHIRAGIALALEPLIFTFGDRSFELSLSRDSFDVTFSQYEPIPQLETLTNVSYQVPPIIHYVLLGPKKMRTQWLKAGEACKQYHPGYVFEFWDDARANKFVQQEFVDIFPTWSGYKYPIQRADSLRYMVLYKYGGIFLDLDLQCRRPLDPLRRFEFIAPHAYPAGISNGFIMAKPGSAFLKRVVDSLPRYDLSWFGLPYLTVSFSTGCHYLSTIHATTTINRTDIRVLSGPNHLHQLNGKVTTPLFHHGGSSSWHSYDAALFKKVRGSGRWIPGRRGGWRKNCTRRWLTDLLVSVSLIVVILAAVKQLKRRVSRLRQLSSRIKHSEYPPKNC